MFSTWASGTDHCGFLRGSFTTETQPLSCGRYISDSDILDHCSTSIGRHRLYSSWCKLFFNLNFIPGWFPGCLQQHEWQCVQAKQHDQTSCIPWRRGLHSSPWLWLIALHPGARGDNEECDFSDTSSETCAQEIDRLFRRGKTKLSESIWLLRKSP